MVKEKEFQREVDLNIFALFVNTHGGIIFVVTKYLEN